MSTEIEGVLFEEAFNSLWERKCKMYGWDKLQPAYYENLKLVAKNFFLHGSIYTLNNLNTKDELDNGS